MADGVPDRTPDTGSSVRPDGRVPLTDHVGAGVPVAVNWWR